MDTRGSVCSQRGNGMRIGEFLALVKRDPETAWRSLRNALRDACIRACRRVGVHPSEAEDLAEEGILRASEGDWAALRRCRSSLSIPVWAGGVARNLVRELARGQSLERRARKRAERDGGRRDSPSRGWADLDLGCLTREQTEALRLRLEGRSEREGARVVGISREAFRERVARAIRALARAHGTLPPLPPRTRGWAEALLRARGVQLDRQHRRCLELYLEGATAKEIGVSIGRTESAVRSLLKRLRRCGRESRSGQ